VWRKEEGQSSGIPDLQKKGCTKALLAGFPAFSTLQTLKVCSDMEIYMFHIEGMKIKHETTLLSVF